MPSQAPDYAFGISLLNLPYVLYLASEPYASSMTRAMDGRNEFNTVRKVLRESV